MPTFLIFSEKKHEALGDKIREIYPDDHYDLGAGKWLIEAEKTTKDVAEEIGIRGGAFGRAVVFKVDTFSGFHSKSLWEWLSLS